SRRIPGRHGEVGIATEVSQHSDLIVEATQPSVRPRIIQGPVTVDETERQLSIALSQQTVFGVQCFAKTAYAVDKVLAAFAVVVKMDFHVCCSFTNHFCERFHQRRMIFFFRKKERVSRRVANRIGFASHRNLRPRRPPYSHARLCGSQISAPPSWLVVVRNGYPDKLKRRSGPLRHLPQPLPDVGWTPDLGIVD